MQKSLNHMCQFISQKNQLKFRAQKNISSTKLRNKNSIWIENSSIIAYVNFAKKKFKESKSDGIKY